VGARGIARAACKVRSEPPSISPFSPVAAQRPGEDSLVDKRCQRNAERRVKVALSFPGSGSDLCFNFFAPVGGREADRSRRKNPAQFVSANCRSFATAHCANLIG
jgi:hypothetical protein